METNETILKENAQEFLKQAREAKKDQAFNTAVTLYFKALAVVIDLFIFKKERFIPSNHAQRFRILESKYPLLYSILDKDFPLYQESYKLKLSKNYVEVLEDDLRKVIEFTKIKINP